MKRQMKTLIHKFHLNGTYILLDVNSGVVNVIDEMTYRVLDTYKGSNRKETLVLLSSQYDKDSLIECLDELDELIRQELLFAPMSEKFEIVAAEKPIVKALCLNIAHDCNLRCRYCFASSGAYGGSKRELMSFDVAKRAIDFLIANSGTRQHCEVDFFGGEPLLNFDVVKDIIAYIREQEEIHNKIFKLTLTTNGMLLDKEKVAYLNDNHISMVLSLDGRKEVHDSMRPNVAGQGSYETVLKNLQYAVQHRNGEEYYVRGTYTAKNLDFTNDVVSMADAGFDELSMEPVIGEDGDYIITEEHLPRIKEEYETLTKEFLKRKFSGRGFNFFHFNVDLYRGPCMAKRLRGCGAGHEYMAITPNGDIYPCHQFVGDESYIIGTVYDGLTNFDIPKTFRETNVLTKDQCIDCWAKFFCSGGCHANNIKLGGSINEPYKLSCELQKKRIECALLIQAELALAKKNFTE